MYLEKIEPRRSKAKGVRLFGIWVLRFFIFLALLLFIGFLYENISAYKEGQVRPSAGRRIVINEHKIHMSTQGDGKATVVFCSGLTTPSSYVDFYPICNKISNYAKTITYDRPGHGWSDITDGKRDVDSIAREMHAALSQSAQKAPYILVGHSYASLQVIRFAQLYKDEVAGIVLIDGGNPEYYAQNGLKTPFTTVYTYKFLKATGIARLVLYHTNYFSKNLQSVPEDLRQVYLEMVLKTMYNKNIIDEGNRTQESGKTVIAGGHLGNIPLRIITAPDDAEWNKSQADLKAWSTDSIQIVVNGASHSIQHSNPNVVIEEIKKLVEKK